MGIQLVLEKMKNSVILYPSAELAVTVDGELTQHISPLEERYCPYPLLPLSSMGGVFILK